MGAGGRRRHRDREETYRFLQGAFKEAAELSGRRWRFCARRGRIATGRRGPLGSNGRATGAGAPPASFTVEFTAVELHVFRCLDAPGF